MKTSFLKFVNDKKTDLLKFSLRILCVILVFMPLTLYFALWLTLKIKGQNFPWERFLEFVPVIFKLTLVVMAGSVVHMIWSQWDIYRKEQR